jgi:PAS domain S-box-containing protein
MERKARSLSRWLEATLASAPEAILTTDRNGLVTLMNPKAEALTGWNALDALGKPCRDVLRLVTVKTRESVPDPCESAMQHGATVRLASDTLLLTPDGRERCVDQSAAPIVDADGNVLGAVVVLADATDRASASSGKLKRLNHRIDDLLAQKRPSDQLSGDVEALVTSVSHDLRSPLSAVAGYAGIL